MALSLKGRVLTDTSGVFLEIPILVTESGPLLVVAEYFVYHYQDRSIAWMLKVCRSVGLFLEYLEYLPSFQKEHLVFQNFALRLATGSFDKATGIDPSGLCWKPRRRADVSQILAHLTGLFEWIEESKRVSLGVNPRIAPSAFESKIRLAAHHFKRNSSFLGHLWQNKGTETVHFVRMPAAPQVVLSDPPAFPEDRFLDLITVGFRPNTASGLRDVLITLLLNCAGFRCSEPFHLFVQDVIADPTNVESAIVRIHHPVEGLAPADWVDEKGNSKNANRAAYLAERWGMLPRVSLLGSRHSGWKGGSHDGKYYKEAYWFPPIAGQLFMQAWVSYMGYIAGLDRNHPFAFVNLSRGRVGEPYDVPQFHKAHAVACHRISLVVSKNNGTTAHGHRHAYGRRLALGKVDEMYIKRFMHHSAIESQRVYTEPTPSEISGILNEALARLHTEGYEKFEGRFRAIVSHSRF